MQSASENLPNQPKYGITQTAVCEGTLHNNKFWEEPREGTSRKRVREREREREVGGSERH
jgi:hypothetical protein